MEESTDTAGKGRWPGIAFIDGNPAIACTDISGSQQLKLFEAQDAQGNSWAAPEVVTSGAGDEAGYVNVIVINGYIAISYYETVDAANDLQYAILL